MKLFSIIHQNDLPFFFIAIIVENFVFTPTL